MEKIRLSHHHGRVPMKLDEIFNDKTLTLGSLFLTALWGLVRFGPPSFSSPAKEKTLLTLLRIACGLLLTGASLDKVGDPAAFTKLIGECYNFIPASLIPLTAVVIPWLELFTGVSLILGFKWRGAAFLFCGLMFVYSLAVLWDLARGIDCACGCLNMDSKEKISQWTFYRDCGFFALGFIVLVSPAAYASLDRSTDQNPSF